MQKGALPAIALALALCACGGSAPGPTDTDATNATDATRRAADAAPGPAVDATNQPPPDPATPSPPADIVHDTDGQPVPLLGFDIAAVPPSEATLGELPLFSLPDGHAGSSRASRPPPAGFPLQLRGGGDWGQGRSRRGLAGVPWGTRRDKEVAERVLSRNHEPVPAQAGALKGVEGPVAGGIFY